MLGPDKRLEFRVLIHGWLMLLRYRSLLFGIGYTWSQARQGTVPPQLLVQVAAPICRQDRLGNTRHRTWWCAGREKTALPCFALLVSEHSKRSPQWHEDAPLELDQSIPGNREEDGHH
jgi:hypothetical protein